jgi:hypothetical protein
MKNVNQLLKALKKLGFKVEYGNGSLIKIYPQDSNKPFYSCHIGERALHPLRRFAKKNWSMDITRI